MFVCWALDCDHGYPMKDRGQSKRLGDTFGRALHARQSDSDVTPSGWTGSSEACGPPMMGREEGSLRLSTRKGHCPEHVVQELIQVDQLGAEGKDVAQRLSRVADHRCDALPVAYPVRWLEGQ